MVRLQLDVPGDLAVEVAGGAVDDRRPARGVGGRDRHELVLGAIDRLGELPQDELVLGRDPADRERAAVEDQRLDGLTAGDRDHHHRRLDRAPLHPPGEDAAAAAVVRRREDEEAAGDLADDAVQDRR